MTQNQKLASYLRSRPGEWIAMPELATVITPTGIGAAVHSRVADCRKKFGMTILHRGGRRRDTTGMATSFYMLALIEAQRGDPVPEKRPPCQGGHNELNDEPRIYSATNRVKEK